MPSDGLFAAFGISPGFIFFLVYLIASICVYFALIAEINARTTVLGEQSTKRFGLPEAILGAALIVFLLLNISASASHPSLQLDARNLLTSFLFTAAMLLFIVAFLQFRGFDVITLGGFVRTSFLRALVIGALLLFLAYPLLGLSETIVQRFFGGGSSKQSIVEAFSASPTIEQRVMIIFFAIAVAPVVEEFLFRFFIYGVLKRYVGRFLGTATNALLFAAAHAHLPSFAPLFVLGVCFTIAYEWSGSILVAMMMHSLFNSVSLIALAFPELIPQ
jgi:uncharacterized protein